MRDTLGTTRSASGRKAARSRSRPRPAHHASRGHSRRGGSAWASTPRWPEGSFSALVSSTAPPRTTRQTRSMRPWADDAEIFRHRRARSVATWERVVLGVLLFLGIQSIVYFGDWWFQLGHVNNLGLFILLSAATWYGISRMVVGWYNAFHVEQPDPVPAPPGLRV